MIQFERRGTGKPLLIIHGLGGNRCSFDRIANALAWQRELVLIDLPGHGESYEPRETVDLILFATR